MTDNTLQRAKTLLKIEAQAVSRCADLLNENFVKATQLVDSTLNKAHKIIFLGVGKSHYVAAKLAASFTSAGMTAIFVHPAEAFHGDLGSISPGDLCICLSKSGSTSEIVALVPFLKGRNPLLAIVGDVTSLLGRQADITLDASVEREACPINLLPTASTTVALALGDALMSVCAENRGFTKQQFAGYHPGGALGRRLTLKVSQVMKDLSKVAVGPATTPLQKVAEAMSDKPLGAFCVVNSKNELLGILTEGDLRRAIAKSIALTTEAQQMMHKDPISLNPEMILDEAITFLESKRKVNSAPVIENGKLVGIIQLHDLV